MAKSRQVSPAVRAKIEGFEGLKLGAYHDSVGVLTIGYGHTGADVHAGLTITRAKADELLMEDLATAEEAVERLVHVPLTDNQFGALVSFAFNVGTGALAGSTLLKKLNAGNYNAVPGELAKWNKGTVKGRKVVLAGLTNRRAAEAGLWASGAHVASNTIVPTVPTPLVVPKPSTSPTNWIAAAGAGIPAVTAVVKGAADTVNGTTAQINDAAGAVKQSVTVIHDATNTWAGWINWHIPPVALVVAGLVGIVAVALVIYRHSKLLKAAAS